MILTSCSKTKGACCNSWGPGVGPGHVAAVAGARPAHFRAGGGGGTGAGRRDSEERPGVGRPEQTRRRAEGTDPCRDGSVQAKRSREGV